MAHMVFARVAFYMLTSVGMIAAETALPELHIEPTGGGSIFTIKNVAAQPLTGLLVELLNYPGSYYALWQDDIEGEPLAAGSEKKLKVANMTVGAVPDYVKVQAAIYADGNSSGVPEKVTLLKERRKFEIDTNHALIERLEKAQLESKPKDAVIADLKTWADSMQPAGKPKRYSQTDINQAAARNLISIAAESLIEHPVKDVLAALKLKAEGK